MKRIINSAPLNAFDFALIFGRLFTGYAGSSVLGLGIGTAVLH